MQWAFGMFQGILTVHAAQSLRKLPEGPVALWDFKGSFDCGFALLIAKQIPRS